MTDDAPGEASDERAKWNRRYATETSPGKAPSALVKMLHHLPSTGRALEIAGGTGAGARLLARHGLDVTLADISAVALARADDLADAEGIEVTTVEVDLRHDPFPAGPWQVITCFHFLDRDLFPVIVDQLAPGGIAVVGIATVANLERHDRPPRRFLLDPGELSRLLGGLEPLAAGEGWTDDGIHEAHYVGRRATP